MLKFYLIILMFYGGVVSSQNDYSYSNLSIVVRLKTNRHQIKAAESAGNMNLAKEIKLKTWGANMEIRRAFQKYFGDQVYFINSSDYKKFQNKEYEGIFLGDSLVFDPSIKPNLENNYMAFWGNSPGTGMNVIMLLDKEFNETEIWVRTFGITPSNINRIDPQVKKFCEKLQAKIPKYLKKQKKD